MCSCVCVRVCVFCSIAWFSCLLLWSWRRQESWNWGGLCGVLSASGSNREWHSAGRALCVLVVCACGFKMSSSRYIHWICLTAAAVASYIISQHCQHDALKENDGQIQTQSPSLIHHFPIVSFVDGRLLQRKNPFSSQIFKFPSQNHQVKIMYFANVLKF